MHRDLDNALGLFDSVSTVFNDKRTGRNIQHDMPTLLRQSIYSRLAGYEDVNNAQRLSVNPVMRVITGKHKNTRYAHSATTIGRFETEMLVNKENLDSLPDINGRWVQRAVGKTPHRRIILDMYSSESPVYGEQEGSANNGHYGCTCYHPLFCFNPFGDCEGAMFRPGNVHSADRWKDCWNRSFNGTKARVSGGTFEVTMPLLNPEKIKHWSLRTLLTKLIKIGTKVVRHSRYFTFQMTEVAIRKKIFAEILIRINRLRWYTV